MTDLRQEIIGFQGIEFTYIYEQLFKKDDQSNEFELTFDLCSNQNYRVSTHGVHALDRQTQAQCMFYLLPVFTFGLNMKHSKLFANTYRRLRLTTNCWSNGNSGTRCGKVTTQQSRSGKHLNAAGMKSHDLKTNNETSNHEPKTILP